MFESWIHALVFGVIVTFFVGIITAVIAKVDINKMNNNARA